MIKLFFIILFIWSFMMDGQALKVVEMGLTHSWTSDPRTIWTQLNHQDSKNVDNQFISNERIRDISIVRQKGSHYKPPQMQLVQNPPSQINNEPTPINNQPDNKQLNNKNTFEEPLEETNDLYKKTANTLEALEPFSTPSPATLNNGQRPLARLKHQMPYRIYNPPIPSTLPEYDTFDPKHQVYDLVIAMPSIPRVKDGEHLRYFETTIEKLRIALDEYEKSINENPATAELYQSKPLKILIVSFNFAPKDEHVVFQSVREALSDDKRFFFYNVVQRFEDPYDDIPGHDYKSPYNAIPGHIARQQNCDVASLVAIITKHIKYRYFMFMEDDFEACANFIPMLIKSLNAISDPKSICGVRISYGMSGLLMHRVDVWNFMRYMTHALDMFPVDLLIRQFMFNSKDESHPELPSKFNFCPLQHKKHYTGPKVLLAHIGATSTFSERNKPGFRPAFPGCHSSMATVWNLNRSERFLLSCQNKFISPCQ